MTARKHDGRRNRNACRLCRQSEIRGHPRRSSGARQGADAGFSRQRHPGAARRGIHPFAAQDARSAGAGRQGPVHRVRRCQDLDTGGGGVAQWRARPFTRFRRYARGFHPTATAGTYGSAAAAAKLFGLSKDRIVAAFGVSGSQAAGSLQFLVNGAWNKRYQVGAAAMNGVIAATLARNDFVGATESIEGKHGLLVGYSDNADPDKAVAGLGDIYETMKIGVKPYPSCRYTHAALDALIAMRREHNLTPDQIKRVEIGLHRNGITLTGDAATKRHPTSIVGGQFSMFFTGAVALDQGRFGWDDYERLGDAKVAALADKFDVVQDDRLEIGRSHPFGARVSITTDDVVHERLHADPSGEPNSFPDARAMAQKFLTLARPVLNGRADQLADAILSLERFDRVEMATQLGRQ